MIAPKNPSRFAPISGFGYVSDNGNGTGAASAEATMEQEGYTDALPESTVFEAEKEAVESPRGYTAPPVFNLQAAAQQASEAVAAPMGLLGLVKKVPWWGWALAGLGVSYALFKWAGVDVEALTAAASLNPEDEEEDEEEPEEEDIEDEEEAEEGEEEEAEDAEDEEESEDE